MTVQTVDQTTNQKVDEKQALSDFPNMSNLTEHLIMDSLVMLLVKTALSNKSNRLGNIIVHKLANYVCSIRRSSETR